MLGLLACVLLLAVTSVCAQKKGSIPSDTTPPLRDTQYAAPGKIYRVRLKYELPASGAFLVGSYFGFPALDRTAAFNLEDIRKLSPDKVNAFDRPVIFMNPDGFAKAQARSDLFLNISVLSPILLGLDKKIRRDWLDLVTLYLVTQAVDNTLYFATTFSIRRPRPFTYNPAISEDERIGEAKSNSFFSGHVSFSSTATFFLVKVYTDYHHIKGWKRIALFGAAAVPPALVGYHRMRAGKHFKTDVITGLIVGAATGILVPEIHRAKDKERKWSLHPYYAPEHSGFSVRLALN